MQNIHGLELLMKNSHKFGTSVGSDYSRCSISPNDISEEPLKYGLGIAFNQRPGFWPFRKCVHCHDAVLKPRLGFWKVRYVHRHVSEGDNSFIKCMGHSNLIRVPGACGLANHTVPHQGADLGAHTRPPIILPKQVLSFNKPIMSKSLVNLPDK